MPLHYEFEYEVESVFNLLTDPDFLVDGSPIAVTLPLQDAAFESDRFFPFFEGLLPEGWYKDIVCRTLKIDPDDAFGLLIRACRDCIGAVSVEEEPQEGHGKR